jgi:general secretion pathway protein I
LKKFRSETGTSLLEVMVAVAIASIALVSFITLVVGALDVEDHARKVTEATIIADEKLKEIERGPFPEIGKIEGKVNDQMDDGYFYRVLVMDTSLQNVRQVDIDVFWDRQRHSVSLTCYIAKE